MASSTTSSPIPPFYRHFFATFEVLLSSIGIYMTIWDPIPFLNGINPSFSGPITPEIDMLLIMLAGFYAMALFLQAVLLRARPDDLGVWRTWIGGLTVVDSIMVLGMVKIMPAVGLADSRDWRWYEWTNVVSFAVLLSVRVAFLVGLGVSERKVKGRRA